MKMCYGFRPVVVLVYNKLMYDILACIKIDSPLTLHAKRNRVANHNCIYIVIPASGPLAASG